MRILLALLLAAGPALAARDDADLRSLLSILAGERERYSIVAGFPVIVDGRAERIGIRLDRDGDEAYRFELVHEKYGAVLSRTAGETRLAVYRHGVVFVGRGAVRGPDRLRPADSRRVLIGDRTRVAGWLGVAAMLHAAGAGVPDWAVPDGLEIHVTDGPRSSGIRPAGEGLRVVPVDRTELERLVARGVRRALEVLAPGRKLLDRETLPVVRLAGTPEEIGRRHGTVLADEIRLCVDSTVHLVGLAYCLDRGRWFPDDLRDAYRRLEPFIPERHRREIDAMADAAGVDRGLARIANVFPELFHCSGFAVFGRATADGALYHGRVLDYMTVIGLQDAAVVFVLEPEGRHAFVNVGYAGFVGSVSGMNEKGISLGEMGGRGEGKWDGVPMATLMRRALEECGTLDEVIRLWRESPRTCEYFYVFADGKIPDAVGVAATPERLEVIRAGAAHPMLGKGIPDAVVLSAGGRLKELRRRVLAAYGRIDAETALTFMARPVAMRSNLHDVLFAPRDVVLWVAHASHDAPACERPYRRIDLRALLAEPWLPRSGTCGRVDSLAPLEVVTMLPDGGVRVRGRAVGRAGLVDALRAPADHDRDRDHPLQPSILNVLLRCPRAATWGEVFRLIEACEDRDLRCPRVHLGVVGPGGVEGAFAVFRNPERGIVRTHLGTPRPPNLTHAKITLGSHRAGEVAAIVKAVRELPQGWTDLPVWIGIGESVRLETAVLLFDALARCGVEQARLEAIAEDGGNATLNDRKLEDSDPALLAGLPPAHASNGPAGFTRYCPWPFDYPPRVMPVR